MENKTTQDNEQLMKYLNTEWAMRNNVNSIARLMQQSMEQLKVSFIPVLDFVIYTFHVFNAQCTDGWPDVSPEAKKDWERRNGLMLQLVQEGLNDIQDLMKNPTPEFSEALEKQGGQPVFLLPKIPPMAKGTDMVS